MYKLAIIAKYWNEEVLLPHWLQWLELINADHIFLGDDGSTDSSPEICRNYKHNSAAVHNHTLEHPHEGYFENKLPEGEKINGMLAEAYMHGCDWVLHLDIDEFPTIPMLQFIEVVLKRTPPHYGVYFPICDCFEHMTQILITNLETGYSHYPCHHMKLFGIHSHYIRIVDGMKLDQGITGGSRYIITADPYLHLKGIFKNRRTQRGNPVTNEFKPTLQKKENYTTTQIPPMIIPRQILDWSHKFEEPHGVW